jgi:acyl dehydratase
MPHVFAAPDDLKSAIDQSFGPTDWLQIDQSRIDRFADATGDHYWVHVDRERAKEGPFGATIAHGMLTLSLVSAFLPKLFCVHGVARRIIYGLNRVRFPSVVRCLDRIRARALLLSADDVGRDSVQFVLRVTIETENDGKPACVADLIIRHVREDASNSCARSAQ